MASSKRKRPAKKSSAKKSTKAKRGARSRSKPAAGKRYALRLYVTGITPKSMRAIENVKTICEEHLKGRYDLTIVDIYQQPSLARGEQIIAAPTLVKRLPDPLRRLVGDLSKKERVLMGLDIHEQS
jgi:circadian clock protein KaiB